MYPPPVIWKGPTQLVEQPNSGELVLADRTTLVDTYKAPYSVCVTNALRRGTFGTGVRLGWVVTSSKVSRERKGIGTLTINWEVGGSAANPTLLPLDEFEVQPMELNPKIERHPRFVGPAYPGDPDDKISPSTLSLCYAAINGATREARMKANLQVNTLNDPSQKAWGIHLLFFLNRGTETYYMAGLKYIWTWYAFALPTLTAGGVIQAPLGPMYGAFSPGMSWLRLCDQIGSAGVNGSVLKITSTWLGGHGGYWDPWLYV